MRHTTARWVLGSILLVGCSQGNDVPPALSTGDLDTIANLRRELTEAIVAGDAAAYGDLCTDDVQLLHPNAPMIVGREELVAHNAAMFEAVSVESLDLSPVKIDGVGDLAFEVGTQDLSISPTIPGFKSSRKYVHVLRRGSDGQWRFAVLMSNDS